ncbi:MAG TPA: hypothetical protein VFI93_12490, partial [Rhizomicrobium sp.]|nr:hypothetical protein [Rhizomicrobium sp.]
TKTSAFDEGTDKQTSPLRVYQRAGGEGSLADMASLSFGVMSFLFERELLPASYMLMPGSGIFMLPGCYPSECLPPG